jgi:transcriptional regulator with XRE-family HTH domain
MNQKITPFGAECKKIRIDKNLTLRQFANKIGFSSTYVCNMENGLREPTINYVNIIIKYLNIDTINSVRLYVLWIESIKEVKIDVSSLTDWQKKECLLKLLTDVK